MSVSKEEAISQEEMRKRLYQTFKSRGVLDTLKTQLRSQLIHELKQPPPNTLSMPGSQQGYTDSILVTASNSLVVDHLHKGGYNYTLSVFYPECGLCRDKVFSTRDFLQMLKIDPRSSLYKSLTSTTKSNEDKGFLMRLLTELIDSYMHRERCNVDTQTASIPFYRDSLDEKMQVIDKEYAAIQRCGNTLEGKLSEYRKEMELRLQAEMKAQLQHFKDMELVKLKMEEKEKSHKEFFDLRRDLERSYQTKLEGMINREKNTIEKQARQRESDEKEVYLQRQSLLKEIDSVRNREAELRQKTEAFEKTCKLQEEKIRSTEEQLRRRELALKTLEDAYEQKLQNELTRYQLELKEEYLKRTEKVTEDEKTNKAEAIRLQQDLASVEAKAEEHRQACATVKQLQMELGTALSESSLLTQQNKLLVERLEIMSDYSTLRRQKTDLEVELGFLRKQLEEAQEEIRQLRTELSQPSKELLTLQVELRKAESSHKLEEEELERQKRLLQIQLQNEVDRSAQLKAQLMESQERTQWMNKHNEELKVQLRQMQQALENEVLRNPKPSLVDRSLLDLTADKIVPPDIYIDGPLLQDRVRRGEQRVMFKRLQCNFTRCNSLDSDSELVASAKARIRHLEKEAESLEEAYRSYQQRTVQGLVSAMQPPVTQSQQQKIYSGCPQPKVTFVQDPLPYSYSAQLSGPKPLESSNYTESQMPGEQTPLQLSCSPTRRLSSTPLSISKQLFTREAAQDAGASVVLFQDLSPARQPSPIRRGEEAFPTVLSIELIPPSVPPKSAASENFSLAQLRRNLSSSGSSTQPEKITLADLTEVSKELSHIPVLHQDEGPPDRHSVSSPAVPDFSPEQLLEFSQVKSEVDEDIRWKLERQQREERRQQEIQNAVEREQRELERLEQNGLRHISVTDKTRSEKDIKSQSSDTAGSNFDPLQKYMSMVMQGREGQPVLIESKGQLVQSESPEPEVLLDKDDSIAPISHEEPDDDFW